MKIRVGMLAVGLWLAGTLAAAAGEQTNAAGKFSIWVPDGWVVKMEGKRLVGHNPADTLQILAGPLNDADADLTDEDVADFVDDELDDMEVASDKPIKRAGFNARALEGTGSDEDDDVTFRAIAIDPGAKNAVIEALVYGEDPPWTREQTQRLVTRILNSFRPM
ncbi:MAG: hypothetical protein ACM3O6_12775 [Acidobacteriota bacterium]